jgi:ribosomal protein S18 acetylase RimI-like enzyme
MTIITFPLSEARSAHPHLRRFNVRTDLRKVADLVEECVSDTLDVDGRRYIQQMRRTAEHSQFLGWASGVASRASFPFSGFVWEQDGEIIGNLSLIPMATSKRKVFLIANVAVHPGHRRRGIARKLTIAALDDCRSRRAEEVWLHVREDNPGARELYTAMGFKERSVRTSWQSNLRKPEFAASSDVRIIPVQGRHSNQLGSWMEQLHPDHLGWYLPFNVNMFLPGLRGKIYRFLNNAVIRQWAAVRGSDLLGVLTWQRTNAAADRFWLAAPHNMDENAIAALLAAARNQIRTNKSLHLEFPAGMAAGAIEASGFSHNHTLIWMQYGGLNVRNRSSY